MVGPQFTVKPTSSRGRRGGMKDRAGPGCLLRSDGAPGVLS